ncbi:scabin-related ADP-ribosyltransferase [Capnocytophaga leadbetteri]
MMTNNSKITVELLEENHPIKPFDCEDEDIDLLEYAEMNTPSQYISTSYSIDSAIDFGNDYHGGDDYIYKIEIDDSLGVDVNKTLGSNSPFPNEKEFAVINKIPNENIVDTTHMKDIKKKKHH